MKIADRYETDRALGRGGMGEVWEGVDTRLNRKVAIKLVGVPDGPGADRARRRFRREARLLARLRHPGVPALYDFGDQDEGQYIVMELVEDGALLSDLVAERGDDLLPVAWAALIAAQLAAALSALHRAGLIHRDVTPSNAVLTRAGIVRFLDFGVATAPEAEDHSEITRPGEVPGSLLYMAPELDGYAPATVASDLYSFGCVLYELLAGRRVFASDKIVTEVNRHASEEPPPLPRDDVPSALEDLVHALLAKDPTDRPASSAAVCTELLFYARDLSALPGFYAPEHADPARLYATAIARLSS